MEKLFVKNNGKGWFAVIKGKTKEGQEERGFLNVIFKKGQEPINNPCIVQVEDCFHTLDAYLDKRTNEVKKVVKYVIMKYTVVPFKNEPKEEQQTLDSTMWGGQTPTINGVQPDELPFY